MARFLENRDDTLGKAPGELIFVGSQKLEIPIIEVTDYSQDHFEKIDVEHVNDIPDLKSKDSVSWINIDGIHQPSLINAIGEKFDLHALILEDILNTSQRPKFEEFENCIFLVLKMFNYNFETKNVDIEHISIVVGKTFLITFQEGVSGDVFNPVRERLKRRTTKTRARKSDYLAYCLIDVIVDNYISIIERFGERIEELEHELTRNPSPELLNQINSYKMEINFLRKTIRPVRELAQHFEKSESDIIEDRTTPYLKDLVDHTAHATEAIETYQIMLNDQLNIYHTSISNKLNDTIRVLTIFSVVFIPLTFIAGVYGTNFVHFPELQHPYAYPIFWGSMVIVAGFMLLFFKRKGWL